MKWATKYLRQPNGPHAGQRFEFVPSQVRFLLHWYALDESAEWLYRRSVRRLVKGSGKSPIAAVLALIELCAPIRFDHWDESAPGGVVGKPVAMPLVQIAATAESQTENTMRMVRAFAPKGSRVVADHGLDPGLTQYYKAGGGKLHILTSSPRAAEGAEATFIVGDEPEHWVPGNGGPAFAATLADNLAKSGSRMVETCNAWQPGIGSVAEASFDLWVAQEEGRLRSRSKILYDARVAPPTTDLRDEASLLEALRFVYGDCWWANLEAIKERVWDSAEADARRKFLNQPTADDAAWVTPQEWSALAQHGETVSPGDDIVLFFDGSTTRDATALVGCRMSDGHVFVVGVWETDNSHDGSSSIDVLAVDSAVQRAMETWRVVGFFGDVREWESFVKMSWPTTYADRLFVMASPSSREPQAIAWDMRSRRREFAEACEMVKGEIEGRMFTHDGNPVLARHVNNARMVEREGRVAIAKESPNSAAKIDAAVCMVGARMVRRLVLDSEKWQRYTRNKNRRSRVIVLS